MWVVNCIDIGDEEVVAEAAAEESAAADAAMAGMEYVVREYDAE